MLIAVLFRADDEFREFVDEVPRGCRITIVSDSCHSGGLIEESKEQIGESTKRAAHTSDGGGFGFKGFLKQTVQDAFESRGIHVPLGGHHRRHGEADDDEADRREIVEGHGRVRNRSLPLSTLIEILKQKTGKDDIDVGKLRPTLFDMFGEDATPKVKKFMKVLLNKLQEGGGGGGEGGSGGGGLMGLVGSLAQEFLKQKLSENDEGYVKPAAETHVSSAHEVYAGSTKRGLPDNGILISGCQTDQTSADASPSGNAGEAYGALSNAIQSILAKADGEVTNRELVLKAREVLSRQGFSQRPGLYCSDSHADAPFVC